MSVNLGSHKIITREVFRINLYELIKRTQLIRGLREEVDIFNFQEESGNLYDRLEDLILTTQIIIRCYTHTSLSFFTISITLVKYNLIIHHKDKVR